jgi:hypothetical protein
VSPDGLRTALDLYEVGEGMMRQQLRRRLGDEDAACAALTAWRHRRPGAEHGDSPGRPSARFDPADG